MKKPLIPFGWMPGHWGLKGSTREIARAEYELAGIDLELRLAEIRIEDEKDREREKLAILRKHERIGEDEYARKMIDLSPIDETQKKIEHLDQDLKSGIITQEQYDRKKADVLGEPWVSMPKIHWDPLGKGKTYFELDYNDHFISHLRENGYTGDDDSVINTWLNDICMSISEEITENNKYLINPPSKD